MISIHAPHTGRDTAQINAVGEATIFQSTRPIWGATQSDTLNRKAAKISIHASHMGRDSRSWEVVVYPDSISIHAPHMGRDMIF